MQNSCEKFIAPRYAKDILIKINNYLTNEILTDVVLLASDNSRIPAHRLVLSSASDYFRAMFTNNLREASMSEVKIEDIDHSVLKAIIDFCYSGEIELTESNVETILTTADRLQIVEVINACSNFLVSRLNAKNAIGFWLFAESLGCRELIQITYNYIMDNFSNVYIEEEFLHVSAEVVKRIFADEMLNIEVEYECCNALNMWLKVDIDARKEHLPMLLSEIRLSQLPKHILLSKIESKWYFQENLECCTLILEAMKFHLFPELHYKLQSPRTRPRKSTVGKVLAIGGIEGTVPSTEIVAYDFRANVWKPYDWMPSKILQFGAAILNNMLYIVGGRDGLKTLNVVRALDLKSQEWTIVTSMSTQRHGLGVAVLGGQLYAVGGHDGWTYLNTVERYDPSSEQWRCITPMNHPRSTAGVAVLNDKLYVVGGRDGGSCLKSVEWFDPFSNKWLFCAPMSVKRGGAGIGVLNGYIYVLGGHNIPTANPGGSRFDSVERYDPKNDTWTKIASMSLGRDAIGITPLGDLLLAAGGYDGQTYLKLVEAYDPVTDKWKKLKDLNENRAGMCIVIKANIIE